MSERGQCRDANALAIIIMRFRGNEAPALTQITAKLCCPSHQCIRLPLLLLCAISDRAISDRRADKKPGRYLAGWESGAHERAEVSASHCRSNRMAGSFALEPFGRDLQRIRGRADEAYPTHLRAVQSLLQLSVRDVDDGRMCRAHALGLLGHHAA